MRMIHGWEMLEGCRGRCCKRAQEALRVLGTQQRPKADPPPLAEVRLPAPTAVQALGRPGSRVSVLAILGLHPVSWHLGQGQKPTQWSGGCLGPCGSRVPEMLRGPSR